MLQSTYHVLSVHAVFYLYLFFFNWYKITYLGLSYRMISVLGQPKLSPGAWVTHTQKPVNSDT